MTCHSCDSTCDSCPQAKRYRLRPSGPYHKSEDGKRTLCGVTIGNVHHIGGKSTPTRRLCNTCLRLS